jgi:hypothetical protein
MTERFYEMKDTSFAGVPMAQTWADLYLWEVVLNENPEVVAVVELGSWKGGLSLYLEAQCDGRGLEFRCYDVREPEKPVRGFVRADIFRHKDQINSYLRSFQAPIILFCDNGNKPREAQEFGPSLSRRSLMIVHDWGEEISEADIPACFQQELADFCKSLYSRCAVFRMMK